MLRDYHILNANKEFVEEVVHFMLSPVTDEDFYQDIVRIVSPLPAYKVNNARSWLEGGYLALYDFANYKKQVRDGSYGMNQRVGNLIMRVLEDNHVVEKLATPATIELMERYRPIEAYVRALHKHDLIFNVILGFPHIIEKHTNSVFKIEHINKMGDSSIGTGFVFKHLDEDILITNKHVVEDHQKLNIYDSNDNKIKYDPPFMDTSNDLCVIKFTSKSTDYPRFHATEEVEILEEIVTMGFPSIPMTQKAYLVCHRGEINSHVEDYKGHKLFLFSAKTTSGNSGGPVLNSFGALVGIVTEELFDKGALEKKGKLPYYAAIPAVEIKPLIKAYEPKKGIVQSNYAQQSLL